jgi:inhibitor of cysteine peptidase
MTEADDGKTFRVQVGDTMDLSLQENAASGYRWTFESLDSKMIAMQGDYGGSSHPVGSGGTMKWTLKAIMPGTTEVRLKLWRHWEGDSSVQKRFAVTLIIRDGDSK